MALELTYPQITKRPDAPARMERHPRTRVCRTVGDEKLPRSDYLAPKS